MRPLRIALAVAAAVTLAGLAWEYFQLGRRSPAPAATKAERIVIEKAARRMTLWRREDMLRSFQVSLGGNPVGHKQHEGDGRTPEGSYTIDFKHDRSRFHLALRISYPNAQDVAHARRNGFSPGGDIMIHGLPNGLAWIGRSHLLRDWTDGCIAVTNSEIDDVWAMTDVGTPVEIKP